MISGIKTSLKLLGTLLITSSSVDGGSYTNGTLERKYDDLEILNVTDTIREVDGIESDITLVTVKNKGNKLVDPESLISTVPDVAASYSWEDNTGVNCLIDTNETFVFAINNYNKEGNILDYVSVNAIDKDVTVLWTRGITAFGSDFCMGTDGSPDYKSLDFTFYRDDKNPYLNSTQGTYEILAQRGLAYYTLDGVTYTSFIDGDELKIRSHDSLLGVNVSILHIDYFYVSVVEHPSGSWGVPVIGKGTLLNWDLTVLFKVSLTIFGVSILGFGLIVTAAVISKKRVDKRTKQ